MQRDTITKLIELNKQFYNDTFHLWNQKSDYAWFGFDKAFGGLDINESKTINILDIGCGNARVAIYLASLFENSTVNYIGIDNSDLVLESANTILNKLNKSNLVSKIINCDLTDIGCLNKILGQNKFEIITSFGVIHHIPSFDLRNKIIKEIASKLVINGYFIFTIWNFFDSDRLKKRIVDVTTNDGKLTYKMLGIDSKDFESGDYILDWVKFVTTYRYSHHFSDHEIEKYIQNTNLNVINKFFSDGKNNKQNRYFITQL